MSELREKLLSATVPDAPAEPVSEDRVAVALQAVEQALLVLMQAREALTGVQPALPVDESGECAHPDADRQIIRTYKAEVLLCRRCGEFLE